MFSRWTCVNGARDDPPRYRLRLVRLFTLSATVRQSSSDVRQGYHPRTPSKPPATSVWPVTRLFIRAMQTVACSSETRRSNEPLSHDQHIYPADPPQDSLKAPR